MEKKLKLLFGVILGIGASLFLTLEIWGNDFYKIILGIFFGIGIGLLSDYRETLKILKKYLEKPYLEIKVEKEIKEKSNSEKAQETINLIIGFTALFCLLIYFSPLLHLLFHQSSREKYPDYSFVISLLTAIIFMFHITILFEFKWWAKLISKDKQIKIWGITLTGTEKLKDFENKNLPELKKAIFASFREAYPRLISYVILKIIGAISFLFLLIMMSIGELIIFPFIFFLFLFKGNNKTAYPLLLLSSLAAGSLANNYWHYDLSGIITGITFFVFGIISKKLTTKIRFFPIIRGKTNKMLIKNIIEEIKK